MKKIWVLFLAFGFLPDSPARADHTEIPLQQCQLSLNHCQIIGLLQNQIGMVEKCTGVSIGGFGQISGTPYYNYSCVNTAIQAASQIVNYIEGGDREILTRLKRQISRMLDSKNYAYTNDRRNVAKSLVDSNVKEILATLEALGQF